jgi:hypothetical protein
VSETAIASVSDSVAGLLSDPLADRTDADPRAVALDSPAELSAEPDVRLGVYLSGIERSGREGSNPSAARKRARRESDETVVRQNPPLTLALRYLLTAYPSSERRDARSQHRLLGAAMRVLHDTPVLDQAGLHDGPPPRITLESSSSERAWLWETFPEAPHRPSVSYHVSPVVIESGETSEVGRVTERRASVSRPE